MHPVLMPVDVDEERATKRILDHAGVIEEAERVTQSV